MAPTLIHGKPLSFYLRQPNALKSVDKNEIKALSTQFPFNGHLHLLLAIKDHLDHGMVGQDLLEKAALYIADRRRLGEWMNKLQSLRKDDQGIIEAESTPAASDELAEGQLETAQEEDVGLIVEPEIVSEHQDMNMSSSNGNDLEEEQFADEALDELIKGEQDDTDAAQQEERKESIPQGGDRSIEEDIADRLELEEEGTTEKPYHAHQQVSDEALDTIGAEDRTWKIGGPISTPESEDADRIFDDNTAFLWDTTAFADQYFSQFDRTTETEEITPMETDTLAIPDAIHWSPDAYVASLLTYIDTHVHDAPMEAELVHLPDAIFWDADAFLADFLQKQPGEIDLTPAKALSPDIPDAIYWNSNGFISHLLSIESPRDSSEAADISEMGPAVAPHKLIDTAKPAYLWNPGNLLIFEPLSPEEEALHEDAEITEASSLSPEESTQEQIETEVNPAYLWDVHDDSILATPTESPFEAESAEDLTSRLEKEVNSDQKKRDFDQLTLDGDDLKPIEEDEIDSPFISWLQTLGSTPSVGYHDLEKETQEKKKKKKKKKKKSQQKRKKKKKKKVREESEVTSDLVERYKEKRKKEKKAKKKKKKKRSWKKDSLMPDEALVSEALAELLAKQGHTKRAVQMYEKLRLIIPEKSVFFAQKIAALQTNKR